MIYERIPARLFVLLVSLTVITMALSACTGSHR